MEESAWSVIRALGSLHITCWGFFLAILLLLAGSLAQDEETIPDVKRDYFNSWVAAIPLDVFKPITIWPVEDYGRWPGTLPFPGGATIGLVLLVNLIAAKLTRFSLTAQGAKLIAGLALCLVGATITAVVILGAHAEDGLQGEPTLFLRRTLDDLPMVDLVVDAWQFRGAGLLSFQILFGASFSRSPGCAIVVVVAGNRRLSGDFSYSRSGIADRLQMSKSLIAGGILLAGLILLFGRRGGNVLIHLAVGMLMLGSSSLGTGRSKSRLRWPTVRTPVWLCV